MIKSKDNSQLWLLLVVAIVVAVISSFVTVNITGDVIKVKEHRRGSEVYTKLEVDSILANFPPGNIAKSCDADAVCEMTSANIQGDVIANVLRSQGLNVKDSFELGTIQTSSGPSASLMIAQTNADLEIRAPTDFRGVVEFNNGVIFKDVQPPQNLILEVRETTHAGSAQLIVYGPSSFHDTANFNEAYVATDLTVNSGKIVIGALQGQGSAYACLNGRGELFRSDTPCS